MKRAQRRQAKVAPAVEQTPENGFDNRPNDDPITVKGQNFCVFSFIVNPDAYQRNNGLIDPYKDIAIKVSGIFTKKEHADEHAAKLFHAYNAHHPLKAFCHHLTMGLYKFSTLPDMNRAVEDKADPTKVRPLVDIRYEQEQLKQIMNGVKRETQEEIARNEERIARGQQLAKEEQKRASQPAERAAISDALAAILADEVSPPLGLPPSATAPALLAQ